MECDLEMENGSEEPMGLEDKSRMGAGLEGVDSVVREREREGMFMVEDGSAML
jgi:hypothetical protein